MDYNSEFTRIKANKNPIYKSSGHGLASFNKSRITENIGEMGTSGLIISG